MAPLIALVVVTLVLLALGRVGVDRIRPWPVAVRGGLAVMFTMTGGAHFFGMRDELIEMVPPILPAPALLVTVTGVLELLCAVALLHRRTAPWSAAALTAMLVGMFPANVYAALEHLTSDPADALVPRSAMQVVFLAATVSVAAYYRPRDRAVSGSAQSESVEPVGAL